MLTRLLIGIAKGLFIGGLLGFGLAKAGFVAPGAFIAYLAAALAGVLTGLVAGKPIWAKDAKIEAGMKAVVGALLGAGLMYATRRWLNIALPFELGDLSAANESLGETAASGTVGGLAVTSLATIAGLLGGFYEADNTPSEGDDGEAKARSSTVRVAAADDDEDEDAGEEHESEDEPKKARR
jgi:hypothetical protein